MHRWVKEEDRWMEKGRGMDIWVKEKGRGMDRWMKEDTAGDEEERVLTSVSLPPAYLAALCVSSGRGPLLYPRAVSDGQFYSPPESIAGTAIPHTYTLARPLYLHIGTGTLARTPMISHTYTYGMHRHTRTHTHTVSALSLAYAHRDQPQSHCPIHQLASIKMNQKHSKELLICDG